MSNCLVPFVKKKIFPTLNCFCHSRILWAYLCSFVSGFSVALIHVFIPLSMPSDCSNCIINLEIRPVPPTLFFFLKVDLAREIAQSISHVLCKRETVSMISGPQVKS